jgi:tetratricopeptide (TPR) repeat protein
MPAKKTAQKKAAPAAGRKEIQIKNTAAHVKKPTSGAFPTERLAIYVYWFIILFFVSATFYIIGRSQEFMQRAPAPDNVEIVDFSGPGMGDIDVAAYVATGKSKLLSNDIQGALYDLSLAIHADPTIADAYIFRGEGYMQIGDAASAIADFDKAVALNPNSAVAYYDRAILQARGENYAAAFADINDAIALRANFSGNGVLTLAELYSKRAQFSVWSKNWMDAHADYTTAIDLGSTDPADYAGRAETETALSRYDAAAEDYLLAVTLIAEQIHSAPSIGEREIMSRAAVTYFEKSAALRVRMGDMDGAKSDLQSAITIAGALGDTEQVERLLALEQSL